jgi:hypothetical protein
MEQTDEVCLWEASVLNLKLLIGTFIDIKEGNIEVIIAGMTDAKSRTGKGKPVCVCYIQKWVTGRFYDVQSCLARKSAK